jgi:putative ABC transport system ATP-binding protein
VTASMDHASSLLSATSLHRTYGGGDRAVHAVTGVSFAVQPGEVVALMGPSGSGKSTLLALLGGLDVPDRGTVTVHGTDWRELKGRHRAAFRRRTCGYVFQNLALLPAATAFENVEIPLLLDGVAAAERRARTEELLEAVGMTDRSAYLPDQLSGGQQQRIGIARALACRPAFIFADEPTGSLDSANAEEITKILVATAMNQGSSVVLVTHDPKVAAHASRILHMHSGRLAQDAPAKAAHPAEAQVSK